MLIIDINKYLPLPLGVFFIPLSCSACLHSIPKAICWLCLHHVSRNLTTISNAVTLDPGPNCEHFSPGFWLQPQLLSLLLFLCCRQNWCFQMSHIMSLLVSNGLSSFPLNLLERSSFLARSPGIYLVSPRSTPHRPSPTSGNALHGLSTKRIY